jgi:DNA polymerase I-like protein with 3'-5' exonuclease and polymerase domains
MIDYRYTSIFDVSGTKSFRLSARQMFGEIGGNLQNMPEGMRSFMIPDAGKLLFQVDQSGAEALIVAYLSDKGAYRELFDVGIKPHTYIALNIFVDKFRGKYPKDRYQFRRPAELIELPEWPKLNKFISKDPSNVTEYQLGKKTAHAKSYGMGPPTFRLSVLQESQGAICLSHTEASNFLKMFEKLFPEVIEWQGRLINDAIATRCLHNLFGYPRELCGRWNAELEREALSYIPQSTVGVLTSLVFTELHDYALANHRAWDLLVNVHDAVVGQAPVDEIPAVCEMARKLFSRPLTSPAGEVLHMKSEAMAGLTWNKEDMKVIE